MAKQKIQPVNATSFASALPDDSIEVVVGDEKQDQFFPRVKLKRWNNEVNFSVGTLQTNGQHTQRKNMVEYATSHETARFYPLSPKEPSFDTSTIRLLNLGGLPPERIGSIYELDRHVFWPRQTIVTHHCDRYAMMYYGLYPAAAYLDLDTLDIPEMRISAYPLQNDPMVMDQTLKLIDVHYNPARDDLDKIHTSTKKAITAVLQKYGIAVTGDRKLYFKDGNKEVKFFSTAFVGGHYYYYINLGLDYQEAHAYYRPDVDPPTRDSAAYGLRSVNPEIPDSVIDEIMEAYAKNYGKKLSYDAFTDEERSILTKLDEEHKDTAWIRDAQRDLFEVTAQGFDELGDGFEFEIELKVKPAQNTVPLSVQTKGLVFHYQGELSPEESRTLYRPPNVIGSYAAYHAEKNGDDYKTGKAFHIYRPWAVDATGRKVWCAFDPDWDGIGDLTITVPQDFLDTAAYPIIIDPTFGYTAQGASNDSTEGIKAIPATATAGTLKRIVTYCWSTTAGKSGIYDSGTKVADSTENTASPPVGWLSQTVSATLAAQSYNLAFWQKAVNYNGVWYDTVTNAGRYSNDTYTSGDNNMPSSVTFSTSNNKYSIYGVYTVTSYGVRVWDGSTWAFKPLKVWDGASWVEKPLKVWNGSSWLTPDTYIPVADSYCLLETGDTLLLETNDKLILE